MTPIETFDGEHLDFDNGGEREAPMYPSESEAEAKATMRSQPAQQYALDPADAGKTNIIKPPENVAIEFLPDLSDLDFDDLPTVPGLPDFCSEDIGAIPIPIYEILDKM